ncbi:glycoside hydrolase family 2 protein [Paenibacillus sp. Soil724D2]|uniref:glycoside hydrolase family 2 protein n=1 Tax=Paenibacillus sp. (strain Soil724D2) TaxID=1736392 RepID=UPI0007155164|nr:glycoside hydrolase family 2 [Paenibacillus sp. Soil724D2]KRE49793.1 glycoside hydrolase family 2 [Paenibacillus sp. Soil724D2]
MTTKMYIKDYPRPQFVRDSWLNLNGEWDFRFDDNNVGEIEKWYKQLNGDRKITVPFTYETKASGIGEEKFHPNVWYERALDIPQEQEGNRVILHFQAVDYLAKLWVNGVLVGQHQGGYAAFSFDITPYLQFGESNTLVLKAEDSQSCTQPRGKQRWVDDNFECFYVQTTGIWQSVWVEYVAASYIKSVKMTPDLDNYSVRFDYQAHIAAKSNKSKQLRLETRISLKDKVLKQTSLVIDRPWLQLDMNLLHEVNGPWKVRTWSPQNPNLYDVEFILYEDDLIIDHVYSYFGMRKISIEKGKVLLNNTPIYQRLILDQGYWPDSHLTPPSEEALIEDIDAILAMGYNGVRKHMKIEDARFLYWCDVKGVLVWSEMAATFEFNDEAIETFTSEWTEIVRQQYNHPSIVTWVPFNESWGIAQIYTNVRQQKFTESIYHLTKSIDPHRPVIVNDGWEHTVSDILTLHDYEEKGSAFLKRYTDKAGLLNNEFSFNKGKYAMAQGYAYRGQPIMITEFGGIAFNTGKGWGYGNQVENEEAFIERFRNITQAIKETEYISGYCYTQITDVQQEVNGLLTEDRKPKIPLELIKEINLA